MDFEVSGVVIEWRGPAPFYFLPLDQEIADEIELYKRELSYGWGVIPVEISLGEVSAKTSLIPRDGTFFVPLKDAFRKPNKIEVGQKISLLLTLGA